MVQKTNSVSLVDDSGGSYDVTIPRWCGDDGASVILSPLPGIRKEDVDVGQHSLWRYRKSFALEYPKSVSLGEGFTPLLKRNFLGQDFYFKLEWFNPTGSFKDRGTSLVASTLAMQGVGKALTDSSGNGGSSLSAYCAVAGVPLKVIVPASTSPSKVTQAAAYGAEVELILGGRDAAQDAALEQSKHTFYAGHNWHPFFLDGVKTIGYELWEGLSFEAPDNVVFVAGAGSLALGCDAAFSELLNAGQIKSRPRLLAAQSESCCPIFDAFHAKQHDNAKKADPHFKSLAEGAAIPAPVRLNRVVDAVRRSKGTVVTVTESQIEGATRDLAALGFYCEPTSAVAAAALAELIQAGWIEGDSRTVVILTGSGLKTGAVMDQIFARKESLRA